MEFSGFVSFTSSIADNIVFARDVFVTAPPTVDVKLEGEFQLKRNGVEKSFGLGRTFPVLDG